MRVLGTAGHVDHGKSTLVQAITGTHPDRLKEEKEREMTIDLGFAFLNLGNNEEIGIVDVPGHRDFIENMLAGVGGVDAVLFVVAADEGVMPQTKEHLAIINIMQIKSGIVALTKIDLVDDQDWLDLVEEDLKGAFLGTVLERAPIIRVSAKNGSGINELLTQLETIFSETPKRPDLGRPRLPVDRVFTVPGFGTVVTGTLVDGGFSVGDEVAVMPSGSKGRIRGLQSHNRKENFISPGNRAAVNISGLTTDEVRRGEWIVHPNAYRPTRRIDLKLHLLKEVTQPIRHNTEVKLYIGAAEIVGRLRLLGSDLLNPDSDGWIQLELRDPIIAARGDHYILRRPSPGETLGGGIVLDPHPKGRYKRFDEKLIARLETLAEGTPEDIVYQVVVTLGTSSPEMILLRTNLQKEAAETALENLLHEGRIIALGGDIPQKKKAYIITRDLFDKLRSSIVSIVTNFTQANPLRLGFPKEQLKSRIQAAPEVINLVVEVLLGEKILDGNPLLLWTPGHKIQFSADQDRAVNRILRKFADAPNSPPTIKDVQNEIGFDLYSALIDLDILIAVSPEVVFRKEDYQNMVVGVHEIAFANNGITVAQFRDHFQTSRRYALALLEHLDSIGVTLRVGDSRKIREKKN